MCLLEVLVVEMLLVVVGRNTVIVPGTVLLNFAEVLFMCVCACVCVCCVFVNERKEKLGMASIH